MIRIGKIVATHGLQGALILSHFVGNSTWLKKKHSLMIEMNKGSMIPYFVDSIKANNIDEYVISLEEILTKESAKKLVSKHVFVEEETLKGFAKNSPLLWVGFQIIDEQKGNLGAIEDVFQTSNQWIAKMTIEHKEVLIPLVEQTIVDLDLKKKILFTDLPEGLLEVYLNI